MTPTPGLWQLAGAYLNEDWPDFYPDEWAAVDDFIKEAPTQAALVPGEVEQVLAQLTTEQDLRDFLTSQGASYAADPGEGGYRAFLTEVARRVQAALARQH